MERKLEIMADFLFKKLLSNRQAIYNEALSMANDLLDVRTDGVNHKERIERNIEQIDKLKKKMAVLVDMCSEGDISREVFARRRKS